jgi:hypothetical protein
MQKEVKVTLTDTAIVVENMPTDSNIDPSDDYMFLYLAVEGCTEGPYGEGYAGLIFLKDGKQYDDRYVSDCDGFITVLRPEWSQEAREKLFKIFKTNVERDVATYYRNKE